MDKEISDISLENIESARKRIGSYINRTPLISFKCDIPEKNVYLKLENFQPVNSFKVRGAASAITSLSSDVVHNGVVTASAGNFGQGLAFAAQCLNIPCRVVVPDNAPNVKIEKIEGYGATVTKVPYNVWWKIMETGIYEEDGGYFIHPVCDKEVIQGNASIGLEILEDLPDVDTVLVPFGGGGCACGIAASMRALKPDVTVLAVEVETGAPLSESLKTGMPEKVKNHKSSFVDGMNGKALFPSMWNMINSLIKGSIVLSLEHIAHAVKYLFERNCIIAEGAGAAPVAAVLNHISEIPGENIVCVISGGNIDQDKFKVILDGGIPA